MESSSLRLRALASEIQRDLDATWIEDLAPQTQARLLGFLVDLRLDAGLPEQALDALERLGAPASMWTDAGYRLRRGGELELAQRAFARACATEPGSRFAFEELAELDPAAALRELDRAPRWFLAMDRVEAARRRAALCVRAGHPTDALAALRGALDAQSFHAEFWAELLTLDPDGGFADLARAAAAGTDVPTWLAYADALVDRGEDARCIEELARRGLDADVDFELLDRLGSLDPERLGRVLTLRAQRDPDDAQSWDRLAEWSSEHASGDAALCAWWRSFEIDPRECAAPEELWRADPDRFLEIVARTSAHSDDDELWGMYGDRLCLRGRSVEARDAWMTASALDPDDSEWPLKIAAIDAGRWPL